MTEERNPAPSFGGRTVAAFESRRAEEMSALIANFGGVPLVAPSVREVPLAENPAAFAFAEKLFDGKVDAIICLTGVMVPRALDAAPMASNRVRGPTRLSSTFQSS